MARELERPKIWSRLGAEALAHGNHQIVEMTYQKQRNFDKLSFLYLSTGDEEKLARMASLLQILGRSSSRAISFATSRLPHSRARSKRVWG
jgi:coatomer protein complex subunit alpha (xenin)